MIHRTVRTVDENYVKHVARIIVQQQQTPQGQNRIAQRPFHQQQQTRDQHEVQTSGNCAKLAAEEFATFGEI